MCGSFCCFASPFLQGECSLRFVEGEAHATEELPGDLSNQSNRTLRTLANPIGSLGHVSASEGSSTLEPAIDSALVTCLPAACFTRCTRGYEGLHSLRRRLVTTLHELISADVSRRRCVYIYICKCIGSPS